MGNELFFWALWLDQKLFLPICTPITVAVIRSHYIFDGNENKGIVFLNSRVSFFEGKCKLFLQT